MDYVLKKPVKRVDGSEVTHVEIKEDLNGGDLEKIGNAQGEGTVLTTIVAVAIGESQTFVRNMSGRDVKAIAKQAQTFMGDGE